MQRRAEEDVVGVQNKWLSFGMSSPESWCMQQTGNGLRQLMNFICVCCSILSAHPSHSLSSQCIQRWMRYCWCAAHKMMSDLMPCGVQAFLWSDHYLLMNHKKPATVNKQFSTFCLTVSPEDEKIVTPLMFFMLLFHPVLLSTKSVTFIHSMSVWSPVS